MSAEVEPDSTSQPAFDLPEEPLEVKVLLRAGVGEDPVAGRAAAVAKVAELLFDAWRETLAGLAVDEERFASVVTGASNEVWLWVMGDRPYDQLVASLAGRTIRRSS
jgi:hypothetical protein